MQDLISRQAAIDALRKMQTYKLFSGDDMLLIDQAGAQTELMMLPPAQSEIKQQAINSSDCIDRQAAIDVCRAPHMRNADCSDFEDDEM